MSRRPAVRQTGVTSDGSRVMDIFALVDTHGIALDVAIGACYARGIMPDWVTFWRSAMRQGWKVTSTMLKLQRAVGDVYGVPFLIEWQRRMDAVLRDDLARWDEADSGGES